MIRFYNLQIAVCCELFLLQQPDCCPVVQLITTSQASLTLPERERMVEARTFCSTTACWSRIAWWPLHFLQLARCVRSILIAGRREVKDRPVPLTRKSHIPKDSPELLYGDHVTWPVILGSTHFSELWDGHRIHAQLWNIQILNLPSLGITKTKNIPKFWRPLHLDQGILNWSSHSEVKNEWGVVEAGSKITLTYFALHKQPQFFPFKSFL